MPAAQHLPYAGSRSRTKRSREINRSSLVCLSIHHDQAPYARPQQASSERPAIAAAPHESRSPLRIVVQFAEATGDLLWAIASWIFSEFLDGCAAYALAMYGIPEDVAKAESGDPKPSATPAPSRNRPKPKLYAIAADWDAGTSKILSSADTARSRAIAEYLARPSWRTAISAPAMRLLSKIRETYARQQAVAELQAMDDRSLRDMGISRADIGSIARHGVRPE